MRHPIKIHCLERLKSLGVPMGTILDVGVLTGTFELIEAFRDTRHLLFEPIVEWTPKISANYAGMDYELVNVAVSDSVGTATMEVYSVSPDRPITHAGLTDKVREGCVPREVQATTLDAFLASRDEAKPYLLKIDVDGAEMRVLAGATETLAQTSVVIIEAVPANFIERGGFLQRAGFELFEVVDPSYYKGRMAQFDMVFVNAKMMRERNLDLYADGPLDISQWVNYKP